jgi:bloom syndrome protein
MKDLEAVEGVTSAHSKAYGSRLLGITIKYLQLQEIASGITPGESGSRLPHGAVPKRRTKSSGEATSTPSAAAKSVTKGAGNTSSATKTPAKRLAANQVVASIQSFAYKPNLGSTLPITAYVAGSSGRANGAALGSGSGTGTAGLCAEKRITLFPPKSTASSRPKF